MSNDRIDDLSSSRDVVVQFIDVIWKIRYAVAHSKDLKKYCLAGSSEGSSASGLFLRSLPSNRVRMEKKFALQLADRMYTSALEQQKIGSKKRKREDVGRDTVKVIERKLGKVLSKRDHKVVELEILEAGDTIQYFGVTHAPGMPPTVGVIYKVDAANINLYLSGNIIIDGSSFSRASVKRVRDKHDTVVAVDVEKRLGIFKSLRTYKLVTGKVDVKMQGDRVKEFALLLKKKAVEAGHGYGTAFLGGD